MILSFEVAVERQDAHDGASQPHAKVIQVTIRTLRAERRMFTGRCVHDRAGTEEHVGLEEAVHEQGKIAKA